LVGWLIGWWLVGDWWWLVVVGWLMVDWMVVNWLVVGWLVGWLVTFVKCGRLVRRRLMLTNEYEHETPQQKFNDIFFNHLG